MYEDSILKTEASSLLESVYLKKDVTQRVMASAKRDGKSLIFHLLPMLLFAKYSLCSDAFEFSRDEFGDVLDLSLS